MIKKKQDSKNEKPATQFNPLSWGILFFCFWMSLQTISKPTPFIQGVSWFFLGISAVLWLSIFLKYLQNLLIRPGSSGFFLPLVFFVSIFAFTISLTQNWIVLKEIPLYVSVVGGILWFIAYILILVRFAAGKIGRILGIVISLGIVGVGINTLITSNITAGIVLIGLGVISIVIAILRPTIWHNFLADEV